MSQAYNQLQLIKRYCQLHNIYSVLLFIAAKIIFVNFITYNKCSIADISCAYIDFLYLTIYTEK